jgi:hypothetical protein
LNTNTSYEAARGKILNGGGGGTCHNAAGGGGGNYTAGGEGGVGYGCRTVAPRSGGGLGGLDLSAEISASRVFMGGGGGSGEVNNSQSSVGGDGGGIVLINADEIRTTGACGGITISANGETTPNISNDGAGGAGAGGSIVIQVNTWSIAGTCPITVAANGGDGGSSITGSTHGGGGGGGQGVAIFSIAAPTVNTTVETNNGTGGCGNNSSPCNSQASSGSGASGSGIIGGSSGPLPVELTAFTATPTGRQQVRLDWATLSEINNAGFTLQRSIDAENWEAIAHIEGAGNSRTEINYSFTDQYALSGYSYYQLIQTDYDGKKTNSGLVGVFVHSEIPMVTLHPNPAKNEVMVAIDDALNYTLSLFDAFGKSHRISVQNTSKGYAFSTVHLANGVYYLQLSNGEQRINKKLIIQH